MDNWRGGKSAGLLAMSAILLLSLAAFLTSPRTFGLINRAAVENALPVGGFLLTAPLPGKISHPRDRMFLFPDLPVLLENGQPLPRPAARTKDIENAGWGRYRTVNGKVLFSTSDGQPQKPGQYEVIASAFQVPEAGLLLLWISGLLGAAMALRLVLLRMNGADSLLSRFLCGDIPRLLPAAAFAVGFLVLPGPFSDRFFSGFEVSFLWALATGILAGGRSPLQLGALLLLCLIPPAASWIHYGTHGYSHDSFLVAGVIPWSDAYMHFIQAAEIAKGGQTAEGFNGRFLFPAYFSGFLRLTFLNLQVANFLVAAFVMTSLGLACSALWSRIGAMGVTLFAFLCWLYFRSYGCGLVMTEGLGLTCGLLALACILLAVETKKNTLLFLGIFMLALGSSARPGALFVLPALGLFTGIRVFYQIPGTARLRLLRAAAAVFISLVLIIGAFAANAGLMKYFYQGEAKAFGNFAFSLHGLLTNSKWDVSYESSHGNPAPVMKENLKMLRQEPSRLVQGIGRAYGELFLKAFLYRPGADRDLAQNILLLAGVGLVACWLLPSLRKDAPWITLATLGIFLSIPFAPPWDAEVRPYAATVPIQSLLPALGLFAIIRLLNHVSSKACDWFFPNSCPAMPAAAPLPRLVGHQVPATVLACAVVLVLIFPVPLIQACFFKIEKREPRSWPPDFREGSRLTVAKIPEGEKPRITPIAFQESLSFFSANRPADAAILRTIQGEFLLGIDWADLKPCAITLPLPGSPPEFVPVLSLRVEKSLLPGKDEN